MAEFAEMEAVDAVRMPWNVWPNSRVEASKSVIPLAAMITPLRGGQETTRVPYPPVRCRTCRAVLNPYCTVDLNAKWWVCPFDFQRNHFPSSYSTISENNLPAELYQAYTTIDYTMGEEQAAPVFLFVLDTCLIEEELGFLKAALMQAVGLLPGNAMVGMITYGTHVQVHELGLSVCPKAYVFRGSKDVTRDQILDQLGLVGWGSKGMQKAPPGVIAGVKDGLSASSISRFLVPASTCEFTLTSLLEELQRDAFPFPTEQRASRCTGSALSVAAGLLGACVPGTAARIMAFVGGPCTEGSGMIVARELAEPIRSHKDLDKDAAPFFYKAIKFYEGLAKQLVTQGHVLDLFACSLDQVGVAEMKVAVERSGGLVVLAESFGHATFKESFKRIFDGSNSLGLSFNGIFEVTCSNELRIQGIIGPCASLERKAPTVSDVVVGQGSTTAWKITGLDKNTTLALFFEIAPTATQSITAQQLYLQFNTQYQQPDGQTLLRVATVSRGFVDGSNIEELVAGFDQETAAVIMARLASHKMENEEDFEASRWLDRSLIRLCSRFGNYQKDNPPSFSLNPRLSIFPQFMFNLRRSQFVQVVNNSPDETANYRMLLNRENVTNSLLMIQPSLMSYAFNSPPEPALLDVAAIASDRILVLDAYFSVVVFHGTTIAQWRNAGYHKQPEHEAFAALLEEPQKYAEEIVKERFPVPRLVVCDQHGSAARFLLARLNPSATYNSATGPPPGGDIIFTDDASLQVFMEHLQKVAVQS